MKRRNTEDYYNEKSKDHRFAPSFDDLSASVKNHWEREFNKYVRDNAPIELEEWKVYQFKCEGESFIGIYDGERFVVKYSVDSRGYWHPSRCTNIVKLVPEVK